MFTKTFEIRWSDLDANRHVANSSYANFFTEARMSLLKANGFTQGTFAELGIGPVIFSEDFYYMKEIRPNEIITIGIELLASTADFKYAKFAQYIFNQENKFSIYSEVFFGWFNLKDRKLIVPPENLQKTITSLLKSDKYELWPDNIDLKNPKIPFGKKLDV